MRRGASQALTNFQQPSNQRQPEDELEPAESFVFIDQSLANRTSTLAAVKKME